MIAVILGLISVSGLYILTYDKMREFYRDVSLGVREYMGTYRGFERTEKDELWVHLRTLLGLTLGMGTDRSVRLFIFLSAFPGIFFSAILGRKVSLSLTLFTAVMSLMLPYILLRLRLRTLRVRSSREGEILIGELLDNYRIHYYNMRTAIEKTALSLEDAPQCRKLLLNLSRGLSRSGSEQSVRKLLREFGLSINTSWGNTLVNLMVFSLVKGIRVDEALEDLADTVRQARNVAEFFRRESNEAGLILKYMVPLVYLMTVIGGIQFFGLTVKEFLEYQFRTGVGLTWFIISMSTYITGIIVNSFFSKAKLDL